MAKIARPNKPLADVNVPMPNRSASNEVVVCFMPDPDVLWGEAESRAVLALDASRSIKKMFGIAGPFGGDPNYVEIVSRKVGEILCGVTKNQKVSMLYWAIGAGGEEIEEIGEFDQSGCHSASIRGPKKNNWGTGTKILPPIKYIVDNVFDKVEAAMGVIITDGIIEDEEAAVDYCMDLGKRLVAEKKTEKFKLVLIGIGEEVDEGQLERFDDMFEETDLKEDVDIWSHGVAASMQDESDILGVLFGELISEETMVADSGTVLDAKGNEIKSFPDGLPGKFRFDLPPGQTCFMVHTPRGEVTQDISEVF
ncbi:MAG: VWA domain-containing protein [Planctomycetota bacterium]